MISICPLCQKTLRSLTLGRKIVQKYCRDCNFLIEFEDMIYNHSCAWYRFSDNNLYCFSGEWCKKRFTRIWLEESHPVLGAIIQLADVSLYESERVYDLSEIKELRNIFDKLQRLMPFA